MKKSMIYVVALITLPLVSGFCQTSQFGNMTPQQIQQKAAEFGYGVDTNQVKMLEQSGESPSVSPGPPQQQAPQSISTPSEPKPDSVYFVPEFSDRPGAARLPAFGYNDFNFSPTSFQPSLNVPTPINYVIGPGDEIIVSLWGETQLVQDVVVSKDGDIYIPNVGLVSVNGLSMSQLRSKLFDRLAKVYSSLRARSSGPARTFMNVSTGQLRSVKIYVLGEVQKPGGYTLPALSSAFTALYYSGGPTIDGSLRNVEVVRGGKLIADIDLYDYLTRGDQSEDVHLNDGDIVFVRPAGKRVAVCGCVFRPAIYELKKGETLGELIQDAGGLTFDAYFRTIHINRVIPFDQRNEFRNNILNIDLPFKTEAALSSSQYKMDDGDVVRIDTVNDLPENRVEITGYVRQPGSYELSGPGMTVSELVARADSLLPGAFLGKATLVRTLPSEKQEVISFDLGGALEGNNSDNLILRNRDSLHVYSEDEFHPTRSVTITGQVRNPGTYTRLADMTLSDLIIDAGGLTDFATTKNIEVTRMDTVNSDIFATKFTVDLPRDYWTARKKDDFKLRDFDRVLVKTDTAKRYPQTVEVSGEVSFPGTYTILYRGERLASFIKRAGGLRSSAYTEGMYLVRKNPELGILKAVSIPDTAFLRIYQGQPIIDRSQFNDEFGNRIPIQWSDILKDTSSIYNLQLMPGDSLVVPNDPGTITVAGDVGLPSTVPYKRGADLAYYIKQAGGYTPTSGSGKEIVLLPNGQKWYRSGWFFISNPRILAGSIIYVPSELKAPSANVWPTIRDIITVVSSAAVLILTIQRL